MSKINAWAAMEAGAPLQEYQFDAGPLGKDDVEIDVINSGICHSDLSMINNDWGVSQYPVIPGHEVIGRVVARGDNVKNVEVGQIVGVGWMSGSCNTCHQCMSGHHNHCGDVKKTIVQGEGGFADKIRAQAAWAVPVPESLDIESAGPLMCAGVTVFAPMVDNNISPTHRVGVIGIGGLGHLALKFLNAWGCEVVAFTSNMDKEADLKAMGAHVVTNSRDPKSMQALQGKLDFIISTVNVSLDWAGYMALLAPEGRLITVGMVDEPMAIPAGSMIRGAKAVGGSDVGAPAMMATMLEFAARHDIRPMVETYPMGEINAAIAHLESGKARYRVVVTR